MNRIVTATLLSLSSALAFAAKPLPMITIEGDKFVANGKEFKIWGFNMGHGLHLSDTLLREQANQMEFLGVNMLRLHTIDWTVWGEGDANGEGQSSGLLPVGPDRKDTRHLVNVGNFFRFMNALREKSIYVAITLSVCGNYVPGDADILTTTPEDKKAWIEAVNIMNKPGAEDLQNFKILPVFDERALALRKEWAANLLSLKNPKTGLKLAEDPQLALLNAVNECSSWSTFFRNSYHKGLPPYFLNKVKVRWNAWLKAKYPTDAELARAWKAEGKKGLLSGESVEKGTVDLLPLDPITLSKEKAAEKGYPAFSEARLMDYIRFLFEMDAAHQRDLREHYKKLGWTRPSGYADAVGIDGRTGPMWMKTDLLPYVEEHPYDEANIDPYMWGTIRIPTYLGSGFFSPQDLDRPIWGSEFREGAGWISWTRIPGPLFVAAYHSLEGRDGLTWHVWSMNRDHLLNDALMVRNLSWCHCNWDIPWLFAYRAAGRLFKSCEIKPLDKNDPALVRFVEQWGGKVNADFSNDQVHRVAGENRAILTVRTDRFSAVATPYPQAVDFKDVKVNLTAKTNNVVIVEKISDTVYEVTAVGTSGAMKSGSSIHFDPQEFVAGTVTFKGRKIARIDHIDHRGRVIETTQTRGSDMTFIPWVRLYRVTVQ